MTPELFVKFAGWSGSLLLLLIITRAWWIGLPRRYPWFCSYLAYVLLSSILALWIYSVNPKFYGIFYWASEAAALLLGVAVSFEILGRVFESFPAIRSIGKTTFQLLLGLAVLRVVFTAAGESPVSLWFELERDIRALQAIILIVLGMLSLYYSITLNRNQAGILAGYGLFISCTVINLALRSHVGTGFQDAWTLLQPLQYIVCEAIWFACLWKVSAPAPSQRDPQQRTDSNPALALEARLERLRGQLNLRRIS